MSTMTVSPELILMKSDGLLLAFVVSDFEFANVTVADGPVSAILTAGGAIDCARQMKTGNIRTLATTASPRRRGGIFTETDVG